MVVPVSDLDETMREFGPSFDRLGLRPRQAKKMIRQAISAGAADPDMPAGAIREWWIRVFEGSPTTDRGFEALGMDRQEVARAVHAGGFEAKEALGATLDALRELDDRFERHQAAVDLFGVAAEDLGEALFAMEVP